MRYEQFINDKVCVVFFDDPLEKFPISIDDGCEGVSLTLTEWKRIKDFVEQHLGK